uniref:L-type lectin-domain containing receptor kinase VIII.2 n=1 Tax=Anthurium amnicola TaxID=1678845 RepID=A0A1D1Z1N3_9ARAE
METGKACQGREWAALSVSSVVSSFLSRCSVALPFYLVLFVAHSASGVADGAPFCFSFQTFEAAPWSSEPEIALYGGAQVANSTVRMTSPRKMSRGGIMYGKPLAFGTKTSFSTCFSFSLTPAIGGGLALLIAPSNVRPESLDGHLLGLWPAVLAVAFDTSMDSQTGDPNGNHVGIDLGKMVSSETGNVSELNLVLNSGEKLQSWIDYDGYSKILKVRLSKFGSLRPSKSFISYPLDLSGLIRRNAMYVCISSSSGNSTQTSTLYSWAFRLEHGAACLMHSEPLDPQPFLDAPKYPLLQLRRGYLPGVLIGLIFGSACGAIITIVVLLAWTAIVQRHLVAPVELPMHPVEYGYEKSMVPGESL